MGVQENKIEHTNIRIVLVLYIIVGLFWLVLVPPFEKPDEIHHFAYIQFIERQNRLPHQILDDDIILQFESHQPPLYYIIDAVAYRIFLRIGLAKTSLNNWIPKINHSFMKDGTRENNIFFFHSENIFSPDSDYPYDVAFIRLLSLFWGGIAIFFIYKTSLIVFHDNSWLAILSASLVAFLPQFLFITSSINNDNLVIAISSICIYYFTKLISENNNVKIINFYILGGLLGIGLISKLPILSLLPLTLLFFAFPKSKPLLERLKYLTAIIIGIITISCWWFIRNLLLYEEILGNHWAVNPNNFNRMVLQRTLFSDYFFSIKSDFWKYVGETFVGRFGFMHIPLPSIIYRFYSLILLVSTIGVLYYIIQKTNTFVKKKYILFFSLAVILALCQLIYLNLTIASPQGRFLFHVLPAFSILCVIGFLGFFILFRGRKLLADFSPPKVSVSLKVITISTLILLVVFNIYIFMDIIIPLYY